MIETRRSFLRSTMAAALAWLPVRAWAGHPAGSAAGGDRLSIAMDREFGGKRPTGSDQVTLQAPDTAEDGAVVPITVESELRNVDAIWIFVEKNPNPLAARFQFEQSLDPFVSLRIKMNESCEVVAVARVEDEYFSARKRVRVVVGGCG